MSRTRSGIVVAMLLFVISGEKTDDRSRASRCGAVFANAHSEDKKRKIDMGGGGVRLQIRRIAVSNFQCSYIFNIDRCSLKQKPQMKMGKHGRRGRTD